MATHKKTRDLVLPMSRVKRQRRRARLLKALQQADEPKTIGQLFLITGLSHTEMYTYLKEFREEGFARSQMTTIYTELFNGIRNRAEARHWVITDKGENKKL